jgi:hypothetical protein
MILGNWKGAAMGDVRNPVADELRFIQHAFTRLAVLRLHFTFHERLRIAELLRNCADEMDHGGAATDTCTHR